jgi:thioredoxin reductase (NADPH)
MNFVTNVDLSQRPFKLILDSGDEVYTKTLIIATGASAKWIGIPSEQELQNRGVSACATCDGFFFRNKDVVVVGGGDTAMEEAIYLSKMCNSVTVIHRRDTLRASKAMADRAIANPKIKFEWNSEVNEIKDVSLNKVTGVVLKNTVDSSFKEISCDGVFVAIGHTPNTKLFIDQLPMDENGYLITNGVKTPVEGCFAAGDVWDTHYRQAITAAGMGCQAAIDAIRYLETS